MVRKQIHDEFKSRKMNFFATGYLVRKVINWP